jgi:hypothetical protein
MSYMVSVLYGEGLICWVSYMVSVLYGECLICWVSYMVRDLNGRVSFCWMSLCWVPLYWKSWLLFVFFVYFWIFGLSFAPFLKTRLHFWASFILAPDLCIYLLFPFYKFVVWEREGTPALAFFFILFLLLSVANFKLIRNLLVTYVAHCYQTFDYVIKL